MHTQLGMHLSGKILDRSIASDNFVGHEHKDRAEWLPVPWEFPMEGSVHRSTAIYRPLTTLRTAVHWLLREGRLDIGLTIDYGLNGARGRPHSEAVIRAGSAQLKVPLGTAVGVEGPTAMARVGKSQLGRSQGRGRR
jgi:hypothetical protein